LEKQSKGVAKYSNGFNPTMHPSVIDQPKSWKKPTMIFLCSMSDLFLDDIPFDFQRQIFDTIRAFPQHIFQVLTKRSQNMVQVVKKYEKEFAKLHNVWWGISASVPKDLHDHTVNLNAMRGLKFLSIEPILSGEIEIPYWIDWVIVGGESGPNARPSDLRWYRYIRKQCSDLGIDLFFKQMPVNGKLVKKPENFPHDLRSQQIPDPWTNQVHQQMTFF